MYIFTRPGLQYRPRSIRTGIQFVRKPWVPSLRTQRPWVISLS